MGVLLRVRVAFSEKSGSGLFRVPGSVAAGDGVGGLGGRA